MKVPGSAAFAALVVLLAGCATAPQTPVAFDQNSVGSQGGRVGVAMSALPKPDTAFPGAGCLLCMIAASAANTSLTTHARTLPVDDLASLKTEVADLLRKKGTEVTVIDEELDFKKLPDMSTKGPNVPRKDFSALQKKYQIDKILVIEITSVGFVRNYSAYIPSGDPTSLVEGAGYIVNFKTQTYEWFVPVKVIKAAEQGWDEPPKFPGLTNAYFFAVETGKDSILSPFKN